MKHYGKFVAYYRVSTKRQGESGLGLEGQRKAVAELIERWAVGVGRRVHGNRERQERPQPPSLAAASWRWRNTRHRQAHFLTGLHNAGVKFVAVDMPEANEMVVTIMAAVAQAERRMISERTKAALAAATARGVKLGTPRRDTFPAEARDRGSRKGGASTKAKAIGFAKTFAPSWTSLPGYRLTPLPPSWRGAVIRRHAAANGRRAR